MKFSVKRVTVLVLFIVIRVTRQNSCPKENSCFCIKLEETCGESVQIVSKKFSFSSDSRNFTGMTLFNCVSILITICLHQRSPIRMVNHFDSSVICARLVQIHAPRLVPKSEVLMGDLDINWFTLIYKT